MTAATKSGVFPRAAIRVELPARPAWATALLAEQPATPVLVDAGVALEVIDAAGVVALRARVRGAEPLCDAALSATVRRTYTRIGRWLAERGLFAWRHWNYLPRMSPDRYRIFNVGRFEALRSETGGALTAASAVGHAGAELVIDVLAGPTPGIALDNPRQRPPERYSTRWGPRPPCFVRATLLPAATFGWPTARRCALVSGTASIVGEDSLHPGDLDAQLAETCANLAALAPLGGYRTLRAYVADASSTSFVEAALQRRFAAADPIELAVADLCRAELLVEIEGLAVFDA